MLHRGILTKLWKELEVDLKKYFLKFLFKIIVIELVLICLCVFFVYESRPAKENEIHQIEIKVEDIKYIRIIRDNRFIVISNSIEYQFYELGEFAEYSNAELYENIKVGDVLKISYETKYGKYNRVISASSESEIYRSIESYYSQKIPSSVTIIIFVLLQLIFIFLMVVYIIFNQKNFRKNKTHK